MEPHVALLHVSPRDVPAALPQTVQCGNHVFNDQGEVWRGGPGEDARRAVNEVLCKVLCHNLCCLIQSMYELGIEPTFWGVP